MIPVPPYVALIVVRVCLLILARPDQGGYISHTPVEQAAMETP